MSLRAEVACSNSGCPCPLRACSCFIGCLNLVWMSVGVAISPELLKEYEYIITFCITIAAHLILILAVIFEIEVMLLIWFGYAVEFILGFPIRIESVIGPYRKLYDPAIQKYPILVCILEFVIVKSVFFYFIRIVCSYYLQLRENRPVEDRDPELRLRDAVSRIEVPRATKFNI